MAATVQRKRDKKITAFDDFDRENKIGCDPLLGLYKYLLFRSVKMGSEVVQITQSKSKTQSGAIAERSRACVCSGFVVWVPGLNPAWGHFFSGWMAN